MIFISYGHDQYESIIRRLAEDLKQEGFRVWIDYERLYGSSKWEEHIEQGIYASRWVVVFMTNHSMRRPDGYCLDEISYARLYSKQIMPIKIQDVPPPISIARIQWVDMSRCMGPDGKLDEDYYREKKEEVKGILNGILQQSVDASAQYDLLHCLSPLDNESYLVPNRRFYGRQWLFDAYEHWLSSNRNSRVLAIIGPAGSGKTAFVSKLCERSPHVAAIHFCKYNNDERANPKRAIMSLAYHLSTQIPEYRQLLMRLTDLDRLLQKSTSRLFEYLFIEPLMQIEAPGKKIVLIIDALDEATKNMKNELVNLITREFHKTPEWLGLVVTTRPEQDIARKLAHLNPVVIDNNSQDNMADIRGYLELNLAQRIACKSPREQARIIKTLLRKSEGNFLYAAEIVEALEAGTLDIENVDDFPEGLTNIYASYFERLFSLDQTFDYRREVRPLMEILASNFEPIHVDTLAEILDMDEYMMGDLQDHIFVLFPTRQGYIEPIHKSLIDWLVNKEHSGSYAVSLKMAHTRMAEYFLKHYHRGDWPDYMVKYLTKHLLGSKEPTRAEILLGDMQLQRRRIALVGQDTAIHEYLEELLELSQVERSSAIGVLQSETFQTIFCENRRFFYNAGLYFVLRTIGFDAVAERYMAIDSIEILAGCVNYYYINEQYHQASELAGRIARTYTQPEHYGLLAEIENEIALCHRKLVNFDDALVHSFKVCDTLGAGCPDFYEVALAHQTIGKVYYHRMQWEPAYRELCTAVALLEKSLEMTGDADYTKMLELYVAAFEREVALSLVWQRRIPLAKQHLAHAEEIYKRLLSTDRYYIRFLYVGMFADLVCGAYAEAEGIYPELLRQARSKYDKSQIEFYYALGQYWAGNVPEATRHIRLAYDYACTIDAYLEFNEIVLLKNLLEGGQDLHTGMKMLETNRDIQNWIGFVRQFIRREGTENEV